MILLAQGQPAKGEVGVFWDKEARLRWRKAQTGAMLSFMLPALSIVLGDPIMSLLDTIFIGQVPAFRRNIICRQASS